MKKTVLFLFLAAGLLACSKEPVQQEKTSAGVPMKFEINVAGTKAQKTAWAENDVIYVFFNGLEGKYLTLTCEADGSWTNVPVGELTDADFTGLTTQTLTAVHFPVPVDIAYDEDAEAFCFTEPETSEPVYNFYLCETDKEYTVDGTTVSGTLELSLAENLVLFHVLGAGDAVTFACPQVAPVACTAVGKDGAVVEETLQAGARVDGFGDDDGKVFAGRLVVATRAAAIPKYTFIAATDETIFSYDVYDKTLEAGTQYALPGLGKWSKQSVADLYVDLGLPSGLKWAKCNIGSTTETGYGNYYAWGEINPKTDYSWSTYRFSNDGSTFTKYTGYLTRLEKEDDVAFATLGGKFRMPRSSEIEELYKTKSNTTDYTWTWCNGTTEKYNDTSAKGWKITKNEGGATIFLPIGGVMDGTSLLGDKGLYYSSSVLLSDSKEYYLYGAPDGDYVMVTNNDRRKGLAVRPVWK